MYNACFIPRQLIHHQFVRRLRPSLVLVCLSLSLWTLPVAAQSTWVAQTSGTTNNIFSIGGVDANNVWAVGNLGIILKWDGVSWNAQTSGTTNPLNDIWALDANNIWAVGNSGTILKWNGASWSTQSSGTTNTLTGVWGLDANNVWAMGSSGTILKWNGTSWSTQSSGTTASLGGMWGLDANNLWVVGSSGTILKWNGTSWSTQSSGTTQNLTGVWGLDANNIWIVGRGGVILKWDGASWNAQTSGTTASLTSVWGANVNNIWAVGGAGTILKWDGSSWGPQSSSATAVLTSVWGLNANDVWITGNLGVILKQTANPPTATPTNTPTATDMATNTPTFTPTPTQVSCVAQPADLVGWWRAEGDATDFLGSNNGTLLGGATLATGKIGQAFNFDGSTGFVSIPSQANLEVRNNLTLMAWVNVTSIAPGAFGKVFSKRQGGGYAPYELNAYNDGSNIYLYTQGSTTGSSWDVVIGTSPADAINLDTWYHVAWVIDGNNLHSFYINGQLVGTQQLAAPLMDSTGIDLLLGTSSDGFAFNGLVDEIQVANRALSATEIQSIYNADSAGVCTTPSTPTPTDTATNTPAPPTDTPTFTAVPPTNTPTNTATNTPAPPTATFTPPPTSTPAQVACTQTQFLAAVQAGDVANGTINLDGNCIYTLTSATSASNGGSGRTIFSATTIDGHGAVIQRDPNAATTFRLLTTNTNITIKNVTLRGGNVASIGGAAVFAFANLTLQNVRFENNKSTNGKGGAVYAYGSSSTLTVERAFFVGNQSYAEGGAISFNGTTGRVTNSVFANNQSGWPGAALLASNAAGNLTFLSNTVTDAFKNPKEALSLNGSATVQDNIFHNFKSGLTATGGTAVNVSEDYNLFAADDIDPQSLNNTVINRGGHSRTAASPRFVDPATFNYHLQANSPAIDLGVAANPALVTDADGLARPFTGTSVDIGAYEYQGVGIPSLSITKVGPPFVAASGQTQFVLTVINESTNTLNDLRIVEQLPAGATYVAGSASDGGVFASGALTWNLAPLAPNQSKSVVYFVTATQALVSNNYSVSSVGNPALTASGPSFTTPFDAAAVSLGFLPYPDGYPFPNWGGDLYSLLTADDMALLFGAANVCKTQNPCVLTAAAETWRLGHSITGGHCFGMGLSSLLIFDPQTTPDIVPGQFQAGANLTFDLTQANSYRFINQEFWTQSLTSVNAATLPPGTAATGAQNVVNTLKANLANSTASDRYVLTFWKAPPETGGHAVVPYAVRQIDADHYWIYVYDNNYPNNFDRVFKVTYSTNTWVYEGAATAPGAPASAWSSPGAISLRSERYYERFPKVCSSSTGAPCATTAAQVAAASAEATGDVYEFQLDGEGYIMVTRSDGLRAGFDPATGAFIGEIPGSQQVDLTAGLGFNIPNPIRIPHTAGFTYSVRIADRPTEYGNPKAVANLNIYGGTFIARLKGIKLDSPTDPAVQPGNNDVVGTTFDADNRRLVFQSSTLDSDTPSLGMAISQANPLPDYTFEVSGAQMPPGKALAVAFNVATGQLVISNNDTANNTYSLNVERLNQDGTKTTYQSNAVSDGAGVGANVDLGPSWTGGAPPITPNNGPTAVNDSYVTFVNTALTIAAPGVLSNDTAPYGSKLTASVVTNPAHGTLTFNANGSFTYTPAKNYVGADSFTYKVSDGVLTSSVATVNLAVNGAVTNQIQQISFKTTSSTTTPDPTYPAQSTKGVVDLTLVARNTSVPLRNVSFRVVKLTQNNYLLNADGGPGQVGSKLSVLNSSLPGGNQLWDKNEQLAQAFRIGLLSRNAFVLQLDVYASKSAIVAADAAPTGTDDSEEFVGTFELEIDPEAPLPPSYSLYLPVVNK